MKIVNLCRKYLSKYRFSLVLYWVLSLIILIITFITPYITGNFIDSLIQNQNPDFILRFCLALICTTLFSFVLNYVLNMVYINLQSKMSFAFNIDVINHLQEVPSTVVKQQNITYLNEQINSDTNSIIIFILSVINGLSNNIISCLLLFIICFIINAKITIIFGCICMIYVVAYNKVKHLRYKHSYSLKESRSKYFGKLFEQLEYRDFIKTQGISSFFRSRLKTPFDNMLHYIIKNNKSLYFVNGIDTIIYLATQISLFAVGAQQIFDGYFSIGDFIIFSSYYSMIVSSIRYLFNFGTNYQETMVSYTRLKKILDIEKEDNGTVKVNSVTKVAAEHLTFSYDDNPLINDFTYDFTCGQIYGILGSNGTGKSTLIKLLLGEHGQTIKHGSIILNSTNNFHDLDKEHYRKCLVAYAEQDTVLFDGTIHDNIKLGNNQITNESIVYFSEYLGLNSEISDDRLVQEDIKSLSGGERQKIGLIRALAKNSPILLLDEPTSSLDHHNKMKLMSYLNEVKFNKIIIIITHDVSIIEELDIIITLSEHDSTK